MEGNRIACYRPVSLNVQRHRPRSSLYRTSDMVPETSRGNRANSRRQPRCRQTLAWSWIICNMEPRFRSQALWWSFCCLTDALSRYEQGRHKGSYEFLIAKTKPTRAVPPTVANATNGRKRPTFNIRFETHTYGNSNLAGTETPRDASLPGTPSPPQTTCGFALRFWLHTGTRRSGALWF